MTSVAHPAPPLTREPAWWGMLLLIATEAALFALLLASYFYVKFQSEGPWPPDGIADPKVFDFTKLEYISSAGLGVLLKTQKRIMASGAKLKLVNVNNHINDIFRYSGFDQIFEIQRSEG